MLKKYLLTIDLFGVPATMNFSGKRTANTTFGGVCSTIFFCFLVWIASNGIRQLVSTQNPQIISAEFYVEDPKETSLPTDRFPMAFAMRAPTSLLYELYLDEAIFKFSLYHSRLERIKHENGSTVEKWTNTEIAVERCTPEYFGELSASFSELNLNSIYCIAKNQSIPDLLKLQGAFTSKIYQCINAQLSACNNATSNIPCAPQEKIDAYLKGGWFSALYTNMVMNPRDFNHPDSRYRDLYYTLVSPANYKEIEIELGHVEIATDSGWFMESISNKHYFKVNKITEFHTEEPHDDGVFISCVFQLSRIETYFSRSYKNVQELLAEVGGLANACMLVVVFLTNPFFKLKFRESLMNELFEIKMPQSTSDPKNRKNKIDKTLETLIKGNESKINNKEFNLETPALKNDRKTSDKKQPQLQKKMSQSKSFPKISRQTSKLKLKETDEQYAEANLLKNEDAVTPIAFDLTQKKSPSNENGKHSISFNYLSLAGVKTNEDIVNKENNFCEEKPLSLKEIYYEEKELEYSSSRLENSAKKVEQVPQESVQITDKEETKRRNIELLNAEILQIQHEPKADTDKEKCEVNTGSKAVKMDLKIWELLTSFVYKPSSLKVKMEIINEGVRNIDDRLNVVNILKKLEEIDKLKALLLDQEQIVLFNYLPKPEVRPKCLAVSQGKKNTLDEYIKKLKFVESHKIVDKYQFAESYAKIKSKQEKTDIDKKFIQIFDNMNTNN